MSKPRIGLALSGGGARGIAQIGALQALLDNGIEPDILSGTSAGAIVGSLHAAGITTRQMLDFVRESSLWKLYKVTVPFTGLTKLTYLRQQLRALLPKDDFTALQKPMRITATNLNTGELDVLEEGSIVNAIVASSSIPLVFQPVEINGQQYLDGGLLENLPARALEGRCDLVIGVNVMPKLEDEHRSYQNVLSIAIRCFELAVHANSKPSVKQCHVMIEPKELYKYYIFQLGKYLELYQLGYDAALDKIPTIKELLAGITATGKLSTGPK